MVDERRSDVMRCPVCGKGTLKNSSKTEYFRFNGSTLNYESHFMGCDACGNEVVDGEQSGLNKKAVIRAKSVALGLPSSDAIRKWRKSWGLTQESAGRMLGIGPVAFSKYENGSLTPSAPTARLLWLLTEVDQTVLLLAQKTHISIKGSAAEKSCGTKDPGFAMSSHAQDS